MYNSPMQPHTIMTVSKKCLNALNFSKFNAECFLLNMNYLTNKPRDFSIRKSKSVLLGLRYKYCTLEFEAAAKNRLG